MAFYLSKRGGLSPIKPERRNESNGGLTRISRADQSAPPAFPPSQPPQPPPTMSDPSRKKAIIIGGGPVGCLTALSLANNGWEVEIWEGRPGELRSLSLPPPFPSLKSADSSFASVLTDPSSEKGKAEPTRSVNLAISSRGIAALASVEPDLGELDSFLPFLGDRSSSSRFFPSVNDFIDLSLPMKGRMIWDFENKFVPP